MRKLLSPPARAAGGAAPTACRVDRLGLAVATLVIAAAFLHAHWVREMLPLAPVAANNWFGWHDQGRYLEAALAWQRGDLDVARHLYMPGYPLLAVPFLQDVPLLGLPLADPFLPANLVSLLASLWLLAGIAVRLAPGLRHAGLLGTLAFVTAMLSSPQSLDAWVVPWSTSPATALILLCLWAALRFHAAPDRPRWAFVAAFAGAAILAFRPTDMAVALVPAALLAGWALATSRASWRAWARTGLAGVAGVALALGLLAIFYVPIYGFAQSPYMAGSARTGFEWRLLPLRWVTLMLDPRPLLPQGRGLISAFPWIVSGLAGALALMLLPSRGPGRRAPHLALGGAMACHVALYLCYRDLHSGGMWLYFNHHYFKWVVPVASLYTLLWVALMAAERRLRWRRLALGLGTMALLLPWRAELHLRPDAAGAPRWQADGRLLIPGALPEMGDAVVFAADGSWDDMFMGRSRLFAPSAEHVFNSDHKTVPAGGGLMLTPLRPLPEAPLVLEVRPPSLAVDRGLAPVAVRQAIVFGLPCLLRSRRSACVPDEVLAPTRLAIGSTLTFGRQEGPILRSGWSGAEPEGRWTDGPLSVLRFGVSLAELGGRPLVLDLLANPFLPAGVTEVRVRLLVNGSSVATWRLVDGAPGRLRAIVPSALLGADGAATLRFEIDGTHRPSEFYPGSPDRRRLGLFIRSLTLGLGGA
ncbi:hypothetical protein C8P66_104208 [Humitalea rosea]|uniref:Uncharacterized protein n=1 Tax=Humitalea rosea TaxID=990373 RepID=A0A2W7INA5_9PROT|nr:hypothetical protein [Humitalea rosea]PZW48791.1 hypothetical protein C8P66_104208 [Humitalea rosea]